MSEQKRCGRCRVTLPIDAFNKRGDGRQPFCRRCSYKAKKAWEARQVPHLAGRGQRSVPCDLRGEPGRSGCHGRAGVVCVTCEACGVTYCRCIYHGGAFAAQAMVDAHQVMHRASEVAP